MSISCQTISVYKGIPKGSKIQLDAVSDAGPGQTITAYKWMLDITILPDNIGTIIVDTSPLTLGIHTLSLNVQNSCGNWSVQASKRIWIYQPLCAVLTATLSIGG